MRLSVLGLMIAPQTGQGDPRQGVGTDRWVRDEVARDPKTAPTVTRTFAAVPQTRR